MRAHRPCVARAPTLMLALPLCIKNGVSPVRRARDDAKRYVIIS